MRRVRSRAARHATAAALVVAAFVRAAAAIAVAALLVGAAACGGSGAAEGDATDARPHIVLVVCDTLRADHLDLYGYERTTAPRLAEWAREALVFERATAPSNRTRPSMLSLFSGRAPQKELRLREERLPEGVDVLPERLARAGYATLGVSANPYLSAAYGAERGFDRLVELGWKHSPHEGHWKEPFASPAVVDEAERLLDARVASRRNADGAGSAGSAGSAGGAGGADVTDGADGADGAARDGGRTGDLDAPVFLYVHFMDTHLPYDPPAGARPFSDPDYDGAIDGTLAPYRALIGPGAAERLPEEDHEQVVALYDAEIVRLDASLARLRDLVAERLGDRPVVTVVTSDHGESFGEGPAQRYLHGVGTGPQLLSVPLVVHGLGAAGRVSERVGLVDLAPTLLALAGAPPLRDVDGLDLAGAAARAPGRSFVAWRSPAREADPEGGPDPDPAEARGDLAVLRDDWRAVLREEGWRLLSLRDGSDRTAEHPELLDALVAESERWRERSAARAARLAAPADAALSDEDRRQLEALGYTGR